MKTTTLNILGSTGSIGTQALEICRELNLRVEGISAHRNIDLLERQIREFSPSYCHVYDPEQGKSLAIKVADTATRVLWGADTLSEFAASGNADTLLTSVMGSIGLVPTVAAIRQGMKIALANKETLVAAGELVTTLARQHQVPILPVDSEHSAIFQALEGNQKKQVKKLILTASGGPFFGKTKEELSQVTRADALCHPNWSMGAKITVDSATLMNKGLEVIEAGWLFDSLDIEVVIHRESIIHSMVEYVDHSVIAQLGVPSMKLPIQYALTYPERLPCKVQSLDFKTLGTLSFHAPDLETFGCLKLALWAATEGESLPLCLNSANEVAVSRFLAGEIPFLMIEETVSQVLSHHQKTPVTDLSVILELDQEIRKKTLESIQTAIRRKTI